MADATVVQGVDWGKVVALVASCGTALAWLGSQAWKIWVQHRLDDGGINVANAAGASATAANASAAAASVTAQQQLVQQQTRITTLESRVESLENRLTAEVSARIDAQMTLGQLRVYVRQLQVLMKSAGIEVPDMPVTDYNYNNKPSA